MYNFNMNRKVQFAPGEFYHIYDRGVEKRLIFNAEADLRRFQRSLFIFNSEKDLIYRLVESKKLSEIDRGDTIVDIGPYILMPNHFHLILYEKKEGGISSFMQKMITSYTMYFNKKYNRSGSLFGSTFHSRHIGSDDYLRCLSSYIHLNKVIKENYKKLKKDKKKLKAELSRFQYSSYLDYSTDSTREASALLNKDAFPLDYYDTADFEDLLYDWYEYKNVYADEVQG